MQLESLTPVLAVEEIEPCLDFWFRIGFEKIAEVKEGDRLGFVILLKDQVQVMYQSRTSLEKDLPALARGPFHSSNIIYIRVVNLDKLIDDLGQVDLVVGERKTNYGAREIFVREPGGNVVAFAEMIAGSG